MTEEEIKNQKMPTGLGKEINEIVHVAASIYKYQAHLALHGREHVGNSLILNEQCMIWEG